MELKDKLNEYMEQLNCSAKLLAQCSGLSAATISRYRSGERIPEPGSENLSALIDGLAEIASRQQHAELTRETISSTFAALMDQTPAIDTGSLQQNFHLLLTALSISVSELARSLNYDPSYLSRIRSGQRQPARPLEFADQVSRFVVRRFTREEERSAVVSLIGCSPEHLHDPELYLKLLREWLVSGKYPVRNSLNEFLEKLDEFDLNEYIRAIHFDELKVPSVPFRLPISRTYYGLREMMDSELAFLKETVLSKSMEPVIMYSDMPMEEMAKDPEFPKKWMFGMAMMLKKGLHLHQIHNIDRSFDEMMLGLEGWIPMYMTGQISPYYLKGTPSSVFSHFLKVSGNAALSGEAIVGFHGDGRYYLTRNRDEVTYYRKRAEHLLSKASPLMEIYRQDSSQSYDSFLRRDAKTPGARIRILSSLPLCTVSVDLLTRMMEAGCISKKLQQQILSYIHIQKTLEQEILSHSSITDEIPVVSREEFVRFPITLPLSGMFCETDILYTWETYCEHLQLTRLAARQCSNYHIKENPASPFRNIQISILEGRWVLVSKNKAPAIHFLIHHPKMRAAFEHMTLPLLDN